MKTTLKNREKYRINLKKSKKIASINLVAFILLFIVELIIALLSDSKAMLAASFNNLSSVMVSLGLILGLRMSLKDPSHSHRKGYQQVETVSNLLSSLVMLLMSIYIFVTGGKELLNSFGKELPVQGLLPVIIAIGAGLFMCFVYYMNKKQYQKIESSAILTLMKDALSDAVMNIGTAIGILLAIKINPLFDSLTAIMLGFVLCHMSYQLVKNNVFHLSGGFNPTMINNYHHVIERIPDVEAIIDITGTMYGDAAIVDVTVEVKADKSVLEGSQIAEKIEQELTLRFEDIYDVDVQVKPKRVLRT